jgi:hypothetical protein
VINGICLNAVVILNRHMIYQRSVKADVPVSQSRRHTMRDDVVTGRKMVDGDFQVVLNATVPNILLTRLVCWDLAKDLFGHRNNKEWRQV